MDMTGRLSNNQPQIQSASDIIDNSPISRFQVRTFLLCGIVLFLDGFDAQTIGFLAPSIADGTGIPIDTFGPIFSASLVGLMIAAMIAGPIADRWGAKSTHNDQCCTDPILSTFPQRNIQKLFSHLCNDCKIQALPFQGRGSAWGLWVLLCRR